jgi:predicted MFS family arabinose efflux permease
MNPSLHQVEHGSVSRPASVGSRAWIVFAVVFALMVFDYVDRQVIVSMFPHLKTQWKLSDSALGGLVSVISITVAIGAVPLSLLADRWSRVKSIFVMALAWSIATIACAFAQSYMQLLLLRGVVGVGEAAYGTAGAALLAGLFPERMRTTILGAFLGAGIVGSVAGVMLGGFVGTHYGWQAGFGIVGLPGVALAILFLALVRDDASVAPPRAANDDPMTIRAIAKALFKPRSLLITCIAAGLQLLVVSTFWAWMPSFFNREYGLAPDRAGMQAGLVVLLGGVGSVLASLVADRLRPRFPLVRLQLPVYACLLTAALLFAAFGAFGPGDTQHTLILIAATVMTASVGTAAAAVVDITTPSLRATALAILSVTQNLLGLAAGPLLSGFLSDKYGLAFALTIVPVFSVFAAIAFRVALRSYASDARLAGNGALVPRPALAPQEA